MMPAQKLMLGMKNDSSGCVKSSQWAGDVSKADYPRASLPRSYPTRQQLKELGKKTTSPFFSVFLSYLQPLTHMEFSHLTPPLATVRGLRVGEPQESHPAPTYASTVENNLACHIAPEHTLALICDHTLLLQGIQAGEPVTEPKMSKASSKREQHFFARS